jgi:hypothetical protein
MRQFNFETNIEKRSPLTGHVFMVDRMTSDYAERHPLNVDAFIMDVAQRHGADVERVRLFFNYGLGKKGEKFSTHCPAKHRDKVKKDPKTGIGDLILGKFPEFVNGCEPALIEAWNKGAEYHTKGFRQGDTLPDRLPSCKITRLDDGGWIALFQKDLHLLEAKSDGQAVVVETTPAVSTTNEEPMAKAEQGATDQNATAVSDHGATLQPEPIIEAEAHPVPAIEAEVPFVMQPEVPRMSSRERNAEQRRRKREQREAQREAYEARLEREAREAEEAAREEERKKIFAAVAAAAVTLVMIYYFGLLGPAVFGLLAGGLLKG